MQMPGTGRNMGAVLRPPPPQSATLQEASVSTQNGNGSAHAAPAGWHELPHPKGFVQRSAIQVCCCLRTCALRLAFAEMRQVKSVSNAYHCQPSAAAHAKEGSTPPRSKGVSWILHRKSQLKRGQVWEKG